MFRGNYGVVSNLVDFFYIYQICSLSFRNSSGEKTWWMLVASPWYILSYHIPNDDILKDQYRLKYQES